VAFDTQQEQPFLGYQISRGRDYSEATMAKIDREVEQLLQERQNVVNRLLSHGQLADDSRSTDSSSQRHNCWSTE
jgi:ATP-dependent Zn protease